MVSGQPWDAQARWNTLRYRRNLKDSHPSGTVSDMPGDDFETILDQARALPDSERARLVHDLLETLEGAPDTGVAAAWEQEIARRLAQVESGDAETLSRDELNRRLRDRTG